MKDLMLYLEDIGKSAFQAYKNRSALTAIIESAENGDFGNDPCLVISEVSRITREPQKEANKLLNRIFLCRLFNISLRIRQPNLDRERSNRLHHFPGDVPRRSWRESREEPQD